MADGNKKVCVGYSRVSTPGQAESVSPEAQESRIRAWARDKGFELLDVKNDNGKSGKALKNRPGAREAIELACEHRAALVVYSLSRLARSTKQLYDIAERIETAGAALVSLTESFDTTTPEGELLFGMLAVVAQFERKIDAKRTQDVAAYLKSNKLRSARHVPYGYMVDKAKLEVQRRAGKMHCQPLVENPAEQAVKARIQTWHAAGYTPTQVAEKLNADGARTRCGSEWTAGAVSRILFGRKKGEKQP